MKNKLRIIIILVIIFLAAIAVFAWQSLRPSFQDDRRVTIDSFSGCLAAGYPELRTDAGEKKCLTADGQVFTKDKQGAEGQEPLFTASGEFSCLPPKDENLPHNDLCAFGIKSANGYYRLQSVSDDKFNVLAQLHVGDQIEVSGLFLAEASSYDSQGTIEVQSVRMIEASEAARQASLPDNFRAEFISFQNYSQTIVKAADYPKGEFWVEKGEIQCQETPLESSLPLRSYKKELGGQKYCVAVASEGAAGSVYSQYAYGAVVGSDIHLIKFVARFNNCANYPDAEMKRCQEERENFDLDALVVPELLKTK